MSDEPNELASDLQSLLDAEREALGPSADRLAAIAASIVPLLPPAGGGGGAGSGGNAAGAAGAARVAGTSAKALAGYFAMLVAGGVAGAGIHAAMAPTPVTVVAPSNGAAAPSSDLVTAFATNDAALVDAREADVSTTTLDLPKPTAPHPSSPSISTSLDAGANDLTVEAADAAPTGVSSLGEERALVERARNAIARRDGLSALVALREHNERFPQGVLDEESDELKVEALVLVGRADDARRAAQTFATKYPTSILRGRVERAVESSP